MTKPTITYIAHERYWIPGLDTPPPIVKRGFLKTLKEIAETPAGPIHNPLFHSPVCAKEIIVPIDWLLEEFPELAEEELRAPYDYFLTAPTPGMPRLKSGDKLRKGPLIISLVVFACFLALGGFLFVTRPNMGFGGVWIIGIGLLVAALGPVVSLFRKTGRFPRTPGAILQCSNREIWEDLERTSLTTRDLFVGELVRGFRKPGDGWGMALGTILIFAGVAAFIGYKTGAWLTSCLMSGAIVSYFLLLACVVPGINSCLVHGDVFWSMTMRVGKRRLKGVPLLRSILFVLQAEDYSIRQALATFVWWLPLIVFSAGIVWANVAVLGESASAPVLVATIIALLVLTQCKPVARYHAKLVRYLGRRHFARFINLVGDFQELQKEHLEENGALIKLGGRYSQ